MKSIRSFRRYDTIDLKAKYLVKEEKNGWEECTINKVSRKGIGIVFHTDEAINVSSTLYLKIFTSKELECFAVKGILKWIEKEENDFVGGIELTDSLSEGEWIQLVFFIPTPYEIEASKHRLYNPRVTRKPRHHSTARISST